MQRQTITIICFFLALFLFTANVDASERRFRVINASDDLADNSAQLVVCTWTGRMIISTLGNLNFYNGVSFSHVDVRPEHVFQLPQYRGNYHMYFDRDHHLWLKNKYQVTCVDLIQEEFVIDVDSVIKNVFGCQNQVLDLFADSIGHLWLLTEKGLYGAKQKHYYPVLRERNLQDVVVLGDSLLLTFYDNGEEVGQFLEDGRTAHRTKAYGWEDAEKYMKSSVLLNFENGYFQIRNGDHEAILLYFDLTTHKWSEIMRTPYHMNNMDLDKQGTVLYIATAYGYWTYDTKSGQKEHVEELTFIDGHKLVSDCNTVAFDLQGGMWLGTEKRGVLYARPDESRFMSYPWSDPEAARLSQYVDHLQQNIREFGGKQTNCMFTDSRGWSWFGTTKGLYMYKTPQSEPMVFNKESGLLNEVIHSVVEDKAHNIWLSTSYGISCVLFEGDKPVFVNSFNQNDNVPNETFSNNKAVCLDDGTIVMQSIDHVIHFDPADFEMVNGRKSPKLFPKLIRIMVNGNNVIPGKEEDGNVIVDRAISRTRDINLNADQNSLTLTFFGLNYFRPLQTYYRARVSGPGIKDEWKVYSYFTNRGIVDSRGLFHLPLVSLKPGEYTVEIQASLFPDVWEGTPFQWVVHVRQPWWLTTGVFMGLILLLIILMAVNFYYYSKNTKMRVRRNNEEGDMIRKIKTFVENCNPDSSEQLKPTQEEIYGTASATEKKLDPEFVTIMMKIIPYVQQRRGSNLTMNQLSKAAAVDIVQLYDMFSANLYKSPRELLKLIRLQRGATLLTTTNKSVEQISADCGFYTPNYFIGNFFHHYKLTPLEYREENTN